MKTKILVLSDSHGRVGKLKKIITENKADIILFLGDGEFDFEGVLAELEIDPFGDDPQIFQVRGNCDHASTEAVSVILTVDGLRFYVTHGFDQGVKYGLDKITERAALENCQAALFGHTHRVCKGKKNNILLFNPGSVANGDYGVLIVDNGKVTAKNATLEKNQ
ncbi:MAG: YfcE family phosphodiesterase [Lachnospiraceae bacterium]|nr:YfcE family phosphodiesterase [Lachnospiraceae bacterium]